MQKVSIRKFDPELPIEKIGVSPINVRHTKQKSGLDDLKKNIEKYGLIQPVVVIEKDGKYDLIVGQRRYLAFLELNRPTIPAFIINNLDKTTQTLVSFGENIQRRKLPYQDTIAACDLLFQKYKGTASQKIKKITNDLGISESTVKKYLARRIIPKNIQKLVDDELISDEIAYRITSAHFPDVKKITSIINKMLRSTKGEKERATEYGERNPSATIDEIIDYAKNPPKFFELTIYLDQDTGKELERLAKNQNTKINNIVKTAIHRFIEEEEEEEK